MRRRANLQKKAPATRNGDAVVFLGAGRLTTALLGGLHSAQYGGAVVVHDRHPEKLRRLRVQFGIDTEMNADRAIVRARLLLIAVRPQGVEELLRKIAIQHRPLLAVSLAAGVQLRRLRSLLRPPVRWARAMPSPVCQDGRGLTAVSFGAGRGQMDPAQRRAVLKFFRVFGEVTEIPEREMDVFTVTYSVSHGYHALTALAKGAQRLGLSPRTAYRAAAHALAEGVGEWRRGRATVEQLLAEAATPGGTAAAVLAAKEAAQYSNAVEKGLKAGLNRARELRSARAAGG
jgi:pyrroline-5-carboxylate reductase